MEKKRIGYISLIISLIIPVLCACQLNKNDDAVRTEYVQPVSKKSTSITVEINGTEIPSGHGTPYLEQSGNIMIPVNLLTEGFHCAVSYYENSRLVAQKNGRRLEMSINSNELIDENGTQEISNVLTSKNEMLYVPVEAIEKALYYSYEWDERNKKLSFSDTRSDLAELPEKYDMREYQRTPLVRDQGAQGTCWAFAACEALESSLLPEKSEVFSVDHMNLYNTFSKDRVMGGDYTMSLAYLLSWQGPVMEADDPYGDGKTDTSLLPVKHVQEVQILPKKNMEQIKQAVYLYGAVQSSFYSDLTNAKSYSKFYNEFTNAYYYNGTNIINHDVIIVGWDDNFSKTNFINKPENNGAFLCQNSWGTEFGEEGYFWVSYEDSNMGTYNVVYTKIEDNNNYANLYQSDLCGWVGQIGYGEEESCFANIYTPEKEETLEAVGFYAVGRNTEYEVYVVPKFTDESSLNFTAPAASGSLSNVGYYTINFDDPVKLKANTSFAVIVKIKTPGEQFPIAVEYADENTSAKNAVINDGQGYISKDGKTWQSTENKYKSNLCLKAYTK